MIDHAPPEVNAHARSLSLLSFVAVLSVGTLPLSLSAGDPITPIPSLQLQFPRLSSIFSLSRTRATRPLHEIRQMLVTESMPSPTRYRGRCTDCEFRRYCAGID